MASPTAPQKIGILSDTHGIIDPQVMDTLSSCDLLIHAGDICGAHILQQLHQTGKPVVAVAGNNDVPGLWPEEHTETVKQLSRTERLQLPGGLLVVEHGHLHGMHQPCHDSLRDTHPEARVIVYGHTHTMLVDDEADPWIVNPGAAGHTRTRGGPSCLVLSVSETDAWSVECFRFELTEVA